MIYTYSSKKLFANCPPVRTVSLRTINLQALLCSSPQASRKNYLTEVSCAPLTTIWSCRTRVDHCRHYIISLDIWLSPPLRYYLVRPYYRLLDEFALIKRYNNFCVKGWPSNAHGLFADMARRARRIGNVLRV